MNLAHDGNTLVIFWVLIMQHFQIIIIEIDKQFNTDKQAFKMLQNWIKRDNESCHCKLITAMAEEGLYNKVKTLKEKISM